MPVIPIVCALVCVVVALAFRDSGTPRRVPRPQRDLPTKPAKRQPVSRHTTTGRGRWDEDPRSMTSEDLRMARIIRENQKGKES